MKILIVEDDLTSRILLSRMLSPYGDCDVVVNGKEAVECFDLAHAEESPYDLICLDIMMPEMDGQEVLAVIREKEEENKIAGLDGVKIIMVSALGDKDNVLKAFQSGCEAYLTKPIEKAKLIEHIKEFGLTD